MADPGVAFVEGRGQGAPADEPEDPDRRGDRLAGAMALAGLAPLSLALLNLVDAGAFGVLSQLPGRLVDLARIRVPSLLLCSVLAATVGPGRFWRRPQPGSLDRRAWALVVGYLAVAAAVYVGTDVWAPAIAGWRGVVAFHATGLVAEELLFRGALYGLVRRVVPRRALGPLSVPVVATAVLFAVAHLQYHGFRLTGPALSQVAYTLPMGLLFGWLRERTGSLWPPVGLHAATNVLRLLPR